MDYIEQTASHHEHNYAFLIALECSVINESLGFSQSTLLCTSQRYNYSSVGKGGARVNVFMGVATRISLPAFFMGVADMKDV